MSNHERTGASLQVSEASKTHLEASASESDDRVDIILRNTDNNNDNQQQEGKSAKDQGKQQVHIADLLGEYGNYQLFITVLTFIRYICVAMMTNTGPLIAPPLTHWCRLPGDVLSIANVSDHEFDSFKNKCSIGLTTGGLGNESIACTRWTYDTTKSGVTLTDEFNLICDRDWLRSAFQSFISVGVAIASVVFGALSDEHGRRLVMNVSSVVSLLAGLASSWAPNFFVFTLTRLLCTMCDLSIAGSLYTIIVESLGNKYRGIVCLIVTTGWSIGVMVMPWITGYYRDFRKVMLFTVACHVITIPFMLLVGESPRWLLINGRHNEVRRQIQAICRSWNGRSGQEMIEINEKFELLKSKYHQIRSRQVKQNDLDSGQASGCPASRAILGGFSKVGELFESRELVNTTSVFIWIIFNSELLYMFLIFLNSDHDDNIKINYAIGGLMEVLATLISIVMITSLSRRLSLSATLTAISITMFGFLMTHDKPQLSVYTLNTTKLAGSCLTSLVFVIITELFPTSHRQTGTGIASTLGSTGAIIAPFVHNELAHWIGFKNVVLILCIMPLSAAILVPYFLRETKGVELADDVGQIESHDNLRAQETTTGN